MTSGINTEVVKYQFDRPAAGIVKHTTWSLGLWLSSGLPDFRLGLAGNALLPWSEVGPISLAAAGAPICWQAKTGYLNGVVCRYTPDVFEDLAGLDAGSEHDLQGWLAIGRSGSSRLQATLAHIAEELAEPRERHNLMIESLSIQAAIEVGRIFRTVRDKVIRGGLANWQLRHVNEFAAKLSDGTGSSDQLASLCGISQRQFSRAFKQSTGITLHEYVEAFRLESARKMLSQSQEPIHAIAKKLGFSHASGFSIAFKRVTGQTPRAFRQRISSLEYGP